MNEERLRQLYGRGIAGRDARSELAGACAVEPERLLALLRHELPEEERLALLDEVMSSRACREAFELLRVVEAAGREGGGRVPHAELAVESGDDGNGARAEHGRRSERSRRAGPPPDVGPAPLTLLASSPSAAPPPDGAPRTAALPTSWWRQRGASMMAVAACAILAVGLVVGGRTGGVVEATRGAGDGVVLVSPATSPAAGATVSSFVWRSVPEAMRYEFELLGAEGEPLHQATTTDTVMAWPTDVVLRPGVEYRWLVRALTASGQRSSPARPLLVPAR